METKQPQIKPDYKEPIASDLTLGDLAVDVFGDFSIDGYEPHAISLRGTRIDITSVVSDENLKALENRMNETLPTWTQVEEEKRQDALEAQWEARRDEMRMAA